MESEETSRTRHPGIGTSLQRYSNILYLEQSGQLQSAEVPWRDKHHSFIYFQDHREDQEASRE